MAEIIGDPEELMAIIRRTAQQEAINIEAEARRQRQRQRQEAEAEAQQIRDKILSTAQAQINEDRRRQLSQAALENQHQLLQAREELLEQVWQKAENALRTIVNQENYATILQGLALFAAKTLSPGEVTLAADPQGHTLLSQEHLKAWSQSAQVTFIRTAAPADIWGGVIATHADGRRQVDGSFATRLELARNNMSEQVAAQLQITQLQSTRLENV